MTREDAYELLDLEQGANTQEIRRAYKEVYNELQIRLTNAPTEQQKQLYRKRLAEVEEAYLLLGGETEDDLSELPSITPVDVYDEKPAPQPYSQQMCKDTALKLLAITLPFTLGNLDEAYQSKKTEYEKGMNTAPSETIKQGFRQLLLELYNAYITLQPLSDAPKEAEPPKPTKTTTPPAAKINKPASEKPKKNKTPLFVFIGIAAVLMIVLFVWQPWLDKELETWEKALRKNTLKGFEEFIAEYPEGKYVLIAKDSINAKTEFYAFEKAILTNTEEEYISFLENYTESKYREQINDSLQIVLIRDSMLKAEQNAKDKKAEEQQEAELIAKDIAARTSYFTDSRNGKRYKTIRIGTQTWMAENLNFSTSSGSWCYENSTGNCNKYGRLYDWKTAKTVCPSGWHLPSKGEFETLLINVGGSGKNAYKALIPSGSSGFNTLKGGMYYLGSYCFMGSNSDDWWSSTQGVHDDACILDFDDGSRVAKIDCGSIYKTSIQSERLPVRCIKN